MLFDSFYQDFLDFGAGVVADICDSALVVAAFFSEFEFALFLFKLDAQFDETINCWFGVLYHETDGFFVVVMSAGFQCVFYVLFDVVGFV